KVAEPGTRTRNAEPRTQNPISSGFPGNVRITKPPVSRCAIVNSVKQCATASLDCRFHVRARNNVHLKGGRSAAERAEPPAQPWRSRAVVAGAVDRLQRFRHNGYSCRHYRHASGRRSSLRKPAHAFLNEIDL